MVGAPLAGSTVLTVPRTIAGLRGDIYHKI